eukprot:jgi/Tetstr1/458163/TSEL_044654.t1
MAQLHGLPDSYRERRERHDDTRPSRAATTTAAGSNGDNMDENQPGLNENLYAASLSETGAVPVLPTTARTVFETPDAPARASTLPAMPFISPGARALSAPARLLGDLVTLGNRSRSPAGPRGRAASVIDSPAGGLPRTDAGGRKSLEDHLNRQTLLMERRAVVQHIETGQHVETRARIIHTERGGAPRATARRRALHTVQQLAVLFEGGAARAAARITDATLDALHNNPASLWRRPTTRWGRLAKQRPRAPPTPASMALSRSIAALLPGKGRKGNGLPWGRPSCTRWDSMRRF